MTRLTVAEWVLPGHPDKLCDAVADRLVGEMLRIDRRPQCGIEVACCFDRVFVTGLIAGLSESAGGDSWFDEQGRTKPGTDLIASAVRAAYAGAGYDALWAPDPAGLVVDASALRIEARNEEWRSLRTLSDDQAICVGYAQDTPGTLHLPGAHWLARRIARELHARRNAPEAEDWIRTAIGPDAKVIVRGDEGAELRFVPRSVSISLHHAEDADWRLLRRFAEGAVAAACAPGPVPELEFNGAGMFVCGGPMGDNGTTGKKLVMDAYGPGVPIGGGAWSGKDPCKPDRVGGWLARQLALELVRGGRARQALVQLEYRPNDEAPSSIAACLDGRWADASRWSFRHPLDTRTVSDGLLDELRTRGLRPLLDGEWARWGWFMHTETDGA